ncbi:MAG: TonB-dependent receptor [Flavobacteriales bacterium]|nr:TonB-dependent receptor [Flavobacteriales bacterium]
MKNTLVISIFIMLGYLANGQYVSGHIVEKEGEPIFGVNVYWLGTTIGTTTNDQGKFILIEPVKFPAQLIVSFVGYKNDTIDVRSPLQEIYVHLYSPVNLDEFEVVDREDATKINTMTSLNVEEITAHELSKAACCNLSESFETNASVDVVYSDAVSGAKKIQMLGLDGIYTQLMFENIPNVRGLSSPYGLSFIPGTWVESIQITKGTGSVVNGYEPITGQINLEYLKPDEAEKLYVNVFGNTMGRAELNLHTAKVFNPRWSTMLYVHGSNLSVKNDNNNDGFLDSPLYTQLNVFNRWKNKTKKRMSQFGFRVLYDEKLGGQIDFNRDKSALNETYGVGITSKQYEFFGKTGFFLPSKPDASIGLMANVKRHEQVSFFGNPVGVAGTRHYQGTENSLYFNAIYQGILRTTDNKIKTGVSFIADDYQENFNDSAYARTEFVPGAFAEYTYSRDKKLSVVLGLRGDYHNLYGFKTTPRVHFKWNFKERSVFRVTAGSGFRTPNVIVENAAVFASARKLIVEEALLPEEAWNTGVSLIHKFQLLGRESSISADYYYTYFTNQAVVDLDQNAQEVHIYNLDGQSYSHSFQLDWMIEPIERLEVKVAYKHYNVKSTYNGELLQKPLVPMDRGLVNVSYETANTKWQYDVNAKIFGQSRLPNTSQNPIEYQLEEFSDEYFTLSGQITRRFKLFEYYVGIENALNYKQPNAIVAANDPYGTYFDASMIYGPINGRVVYGGLRFKLK